MGQSTIQNIQMAPEVGRQEILRILFQEIEDRFVWQSIGSKNKSIPKNIGDFESVFGEGNQDKKTQGEVRAIIDRYIKYLRKIGDPRYEKIVDILEMDVGEDILDNEVGQVKDLTQRSASLLYDKENGEVIQGATGGLSYDIALALFNSVESFNKKTAFDRIHVRSSKILEVATLTSSGVTALLMLGHNATQGSREFVEKIYDSLSVNIGDVHIHGDHTTAFLVLAPFFAEMGHKILQQGGKYVTANWSWEVPMNGLGFVEIYMRIQDILGNSQLDAGTASLFRIARILRGYHQATNHVPIFRKNTRLISKALPAIGGMMVNVTVALSAVTLVMMELMGQEEGPYSTVGGTIQELARLVTAEGFEDTFQNIMSNDGNTSVPIVIAIILMVMMKFVIEPIITAGASAVMGEDKKNEQYLASIQEQLIRMEKKSESKFDSSILEQLRQLVDEISGLVEQRNTSSQDISRLQGRAELLLSLLESKST